MKNLFKSQTSYEILDLLIQNPNRFFYANEIISQVKKDPANVSRELNRLILEKMIIVETTGKKKAYAFNKDYSASQELINLFEKQKNLETEERFKREWLLAEEIINANPWFMAIPFYCFTNYFDKPSGISYKNLACVYKDYHLWFYFDKQEAHEVAEHLVDKFLKDLNFMEEVNDKIRYFADELVAVTKKIPETNLEKLTDKKLWSYYKDHENLHTEYYKWGWIPAAVDMFGNNLTNRGKKILLDEKIPDDKIEEYLSLLTQPETDSLLKEEQDNLIKIGIKVQANKEQFSIFKELFKKFKEEDVKFFGLYTHSEEYEKKFEEVVRSIKEKISPEILNDLQKHYTNYFYTKFIYTEEQGTYSFDHYLKELVRLVNGNYDLKEAYANQEQEIKETILKRHELIKKIKLDKKLIRFFNAWGDFMVTKIYRRYAQLFALYKTTYILEEIAKRVGISIKEIRFMTSGEIEKALFTKEINKEEVKERVKFSLYYTAKNVEVYYNGTTAKEITEKYIQKNRFEDVSELTGQCGCRGQARGIVKIVNVISDMSKIKPGEILVSISTQPDLLPAMKKSAAFITDQGGVTSHAAIVAREMRVPCVIGTRIATQILHDGDEVEVDADKGIVRIIKKA